MVEVVSRRDVEWGICCVADCCSSRLNALSHLKHVLRLLHGNCQSRLLKQLSAYLIDQRRLLFWKRLYNSENS